jgi:hypothetical protein
LTINGQNFQTGAQFIWNGMPLATTFVSSAQLAGTLRAALLAMPGTFPIDIVDGDTQVSGAASYAVPSTQPSLTDLKPDNISPGSGEPRAMSPLTGQGE